MTILLLGAFLLKYPNFNLFHIDKIKFIKKIFHIVPFFKKKRKKKSSAALNKKNKNKKQNKNKTKQIFDLIIVSLKTGSE